MIAIEKKIVKNYLNYYGFLPEAFASEHNISVKKATEILQAVSNDSVTGELVVLGDE